MKLHKFISEKFLGDPLKNKHIFSDVFPNIRNNDWLLIAIILSHNYSEYIIPHILRDLFTAEGKRIFSTAYKILKRGLGGLCL